MVELVLVDDQKTIMAFCEGFNGDWGVLPAVLVNVELLLLANTACVIRN